jgi:hypothetical protein
LKLTSNKTEIPTTAQADPPKKWIARIIRAPFFLGSLLVSSFFAAFILAVVSIGSWFEKILHRLGYRSRPAWLPPALGVLGYMGLGLAGPAYLAGRLIGWPGFVIGPLLALGAIAVLGKW